MTETAVSPDEDWQEWQHRIETLALSICRLKHLPDPDPLSLDAIATNASQCFSASDLSGTKLPRKVVVFVQAALSDLF